MGLFSRWTAKQRSPFDPINLASADFRADPYPFYARLRADSPVCRMNLPTGESAWLVTRYDDVVMVLRDERVIKHREIALSPDQFARQSWFRKGMRTRWLRTLEQTMVHVDLPDHTWLRAPNLRLAVPANALRRRPGLVTRGLDTLPVTFGSG